MGCSKTGAPWNVKREMKRKEGVPQNVVEGINYSIGNASVELKRSPEYTYISFEEFQPTHVIKTGIGFAINEDWDAIDNVIVPAYRRLVEDKGVGDSEEFLVKSIDDLLEEAKLERDEHPRYSSTYLELSSLQGNLLDYLATISRECIKVNKGASEELIDRLLRLLTVDQPFVKFRAGIALAEASKYNKELSKYSTRIKEAIEYGVKADWELEEIAKPYLKQLNTL